MGYSVRLTNQQVLVYSLGKQLSKILQEHSLEVLLRDLSNHQQQVGCSVVALVSMQDLQEHQEGLRIPVYLVSHKIPIVSSTNLPLPLLVPQQLSQVILEDYLAQVSLQQVKDYLELVRLLHKILVVAVSSPNLHNLPLVVQVCLVLHSQQHKTQDNHYLAKHRQLRAYLELQNLQCSKIYLDNLHSLRQVIQVSLGKLLLHNHKIFLEHQQPLSKLLDKVSLVSHNKHRVYLVNNRHQGKLQRALLLVVSI